MKIIFLNMSHLRSQRYIYTQICRPDLCICLFLGNTVRPHIHWCPSRSLYPHTLAYNCKHNPQLRHNWMNGWIQIGCWQVTPIRNRTHKGWHLIFRSNGLRLHMDFVVLIPQDWGFPPIAVGLVDLDTLRHLLCNFCQNNQHDTCMYNRLFRLHKWHHSDKDWLDILGC